MRLLHGCRSQAVCTGLVLLGSALQPVAATRPKNAILLSEVQSLTLRAGKMTSHRRVSAVPQLSCTSSPPALCDLHTVDVMRCTNEGPGYDHEDIQWSCTAQLPPELKVWAPPTSCAVEYRLLLTDLGDERYPDLAAETSAGGLAGADWSSWLFFGLFAAVCIWIVWSALTAGGRDDEGQANGTRRPGGGGGGGGPGFDGGGGGGGYDYDNDPPPPYPGNPKPESSTAAARAAGQQWRPGFWTGMAGGAAATYLAGRNSNNGSSSRNNSGYGYDGPRQPGRGFGRSAGPSYRSQSPQRPLTRSTSSARYEGTGFGSTSRR
ncbi:duf1183 domain containing protein [Grosmannia clavigera kw1407]|uniref:Store-operated calcium entry-associated regulatory factor n=1 Tax=Grosmannia clavigera (strain kw1407 / UAMH 11150) TaxID=655863 RepID=F0XSU0_GROCL|nr:duf1183 domain containing protein [Grosmannia clavigera kw1407]EFW99299.1 duf1183 domain containing protein [Grosmannia clavigera kw1407]